MITSWRGAGVLRRPLGRPGPALEGFGGLAGVPASAARRAKSRRTRPGVSRPGLRRRSQAWRWSSARARASRSWVIAQRMIQVHRPNWAGGPQRGLVPAQGGLGEPVSVLPLPHVMRAATRYRLPRVPHVKTQVIQPVAQTLIKALASEDLGLLGWAESILAPLIRQAELCKPVDRSLSRTENCRTT